MKPVKNLTQRLVALGLLVPARAQVPTRPRRLGRLMAIGGAITLVPDMHRRLVDDAVHQVDGCVFAGALDEDLFEEYQQVQGKTRCQRSEDPVAQLVVDRGRRLSLRGEPLGDLPAPAADAGVRL